VDAYDYPKCVGTSFLGFQTVGLPWGPEIRAASAAFIFHTLNDSLRLPFSSICILNYYRGLIDTFISWSTKAFVLCQTFAIYTNLFINKFIDCPFVPFIELVALFAIYDFICPCQS